MINPLQLLPTLWRTILYVGYAVFGPVLIYTASKGWTGEAEYALYVGVGTALGLVAAANVSTPSPGAAELYDLTPVELVDEEGHGSSGLAVTVAAVLVIIVCAVLILRWLL